MLQRPQLFLRQLLFLLHHLLRKPEYIVDHGLDRLGKHMDFLALSLWELHLIIAHRHLVAAVHQPVHRRQYAL